MSAHIHAILTARRCSIATTRLPSLRNGLSFVANFFTGLNRLVSPRDTTLRTQHCDRSPARGERSTWRHWRVAQTRFCEGVMGDIADEQLLERFITARSDGETAERAFETL